MQGKQTQRNLRRHDLFICMYIFNINIFIRNNNRCCRPNFGNVLMDHERVSKCSHKIRELVRALGEPVRNSLLNRFVTDFGTGLWPTSEPVYDPLPNRFVTHFRTGSWPTSEPVREKKISLCHMAIHQWHFDSTLSFWTTSQPLPNQFEASITSWTSCEPLAKRIKFQFTSSEFNFSSFFELIWGRNQFGTTLALTWIYIC